MKKISSQVKKTTVKKVLNTLAFGSLLSFSVVSTAQTITFPTSDPRKVDLEIKAEKNRVCADARREYKDAEQKIADACRKAGIGSGTNCISKAKTCAESAGEEDFNTIDALGVALGIPAGTRGTLSSNCPQSGARDYFDDKKRIEDEIKETEQDLAELSNDEADIQKELTETSEDIQKSIQEAQQELEKQKLEIKESKRQRLAEFQNSQAQAKEDLRRKDTELLRLNGQLRKSQSDKALQLIAMSEASGKRACLKGVEEARKGYAAIANSNNFKRIATAKAKKADLIAIYNDCMDSFYKQRASLNETKKQEQDEIIKSINDTQSSIDEATDSLSLASTQLQQMEEDSEKELSNAEKKVMDLITVSQQKLVSAQQNYQKRMEALATKRTSLSNALTRANNKLLELGPVPPKSAEIPARDAAADIDAGINDMESIGTMLEINDCGSLRSDIDKKVKSYKRSGGTR